MGMANRQQVSEKPKTGVQLHPLFRRRSATVRETAAARVVGCVTRHGTRSARITAGRHVGAERTAQQTLRDNHRHSASYWMNVGRMSRTGCWVLTVA